MIRAFNRRRLLHRIVPATVVILALATSITVAPSVHAANRLAAAVTTTSISFRFDAQIVHGAKAGQTLHGWLRGTQDSTGVITATLTAAGLTPLMAGCTPYVDFGPACGLPASANVSGHIMGSGASAVATFTAVGKGWTWVLAGAAAGTAGQWAGTLTQGTSYAGTWALTPHTMSIHIDAGIKSDAKSKDKVVLVGAIDLNVTADGWAIGTFSPVAGTLPTIVEGYVNTNKASVAVNVPMGKMGTVLLTGWSRPGFGVLKWTGSFVGPATGDYGTFSGQG